MGRVFIDTNVLFPFSVMDLMLTLAEDGTHDLLWTDALLEEWERVVVAGHKRTAASAAAIAETIRELFPEGRIAERDYANLVDAMPSSDPDDRHHMAAAVAGQADTILTWNRKDFPPADLGRLGILVCDPDEYLVGLLREIPDHVLSVLDWMSEQKRRPPMTTEEIIDRLDHAGLRRSARTLRKLLAPDPASLTSIVWTKRRRDGSYLTRVENRFDFRWIQQPDGVLIEYAHAANR